MARASGGILEIGNLPAALAMTEEVFASAWRRRLNDAGPSWADSRVQKAVIGTIARVRGVNPSHDQQKFSLPSFCQADKDRGRRKMYGSRLEMSLE